MIWVIIWAVLLILVLYSPFGSKGLYSGQDTYVEGNFTLTQETHEILNAPKVRHETWSSYDNPEIPEISSVLKSHVEPLDDQSSTLSKQGSVVGSTYYNSTTYHNTNSFSDGMNINGIVLTTRHGYQNNEASSGFSMANGITTFSVTNNLRSTSAIQKTSTNDPGDPPVGADPGHDPLDNPIPVGDGWELLVVFGIAYIVLKNILKLQTLFKRTISNRIIKY